MFTLKQAWLLTICMYNLFIDESCHLENDGMPVMCIGYTKILSDDYAALKEKIKAIKLFYHTPTEIKWNNISNSRLPLYKALIDFFIDSKIDFRAILVNYKEELDHVKYNEGSHDQFYYKLIYLLLRSHTNPSTNEYKVYLDIKDTRGKERLKKIEEVLNNKYSGKSPFKYFQHIHSDENVFLQITDILIGAITYKIRGLNKAENANNAKVALIEYIEKSVGRSIEIQTGQKATKYNIFDHQSQNAL